MFSVTRRFNKIWRGFKSGNFRNHEVRGKQKSFSPWKHIQTNKKQKEIKANVGTLTTEDLISKEAIKGNFRPFIKKKNKKKFKITSHHSGLWWTPISLFYGLQVCRSQCLLSAEAEREREGDRERERDCLFWAGAGDRDRDLERDLERDLDLEGDLAADLPPPDDLLSGVRLADLEWLLERLRLLERLFERE